MSEITKTVIPKVEVSACTTRAEYEALLVSYGVSSKKAYHIEEDIPNDKYYVCQKED